MSTAYVYTDLLRRRYIMIGSVHVRLARLGVGADVGGPGLISAGPRRAASSHRGDLYEPAYPGPLGGVGHQHAGRQAWQRSRLADAAMAAEAGLHPARVGHARCVQIDPFSEALPVPEAVTNQVTTPPGSCRRSQTQPDKTIALTCRNTTQRDAAGRNRQAW